MSTAAPSSLSTKDPINLLRGWPNSSLLPASLLKSAASTVLSDPKIYTPGLSYGPDPGYEPLRSSLATWLTTFYQPSQPTSASRICITGGASQNLGCMLNVYTDPEYTRNIWLVAPAYYLAFRVFEDAGFGVGGKMRAVPEDEEGLDIESLRREIEKSESAARNKGAGGPRYKPSRIRAKVYKHIIYCVPTFSNPSSRTMSLGRRRDLIRLAREYDALVVCDDVYDFLQWPADQSETVKASRNSETEVLSTAHLPRLVDIDRELAGGTEREGADGFGNVCSNGSFSKIAGPGLRCGWVEGTDKFAYGVSQTGTTCSGGAPSQLTSTYINHLLTTGALQNHIATVLIPAYAHRYGTLMSAIESHLLPLGFARPQVDRDVIGGYFTWLRLPASLKISAKTLAQRCVEDENVVVAGGNLFEVPGDNATEKVRFDRNVRFCWAWEDEGKLEEGVKRIADVVRRALDVDDDQESSAGFVVIEKDDDVPAEFK